MEEPGLEAGRSMNFVLDDEETSQLYLRKVKIIEKLSKDRTMVNQEWDEISKNKYKAYAN